eukprot:866036-Rhodomonas_salina.4
MRIFVPLSAVPVNNIYEEFWTVHFTRYQTLFLVHCPVRSEGGTGNSVWDKALPFQSRRVGPAPSSQKPNRNHSFRTPPHTDHSRGESHLWILGSGLQKALPSGTFAGFSGCEDVCCSFEAV